MLLGAFATAMAHAKSRTSENSSLPKKYVEVIIPYDLSSIDLTGTGSANDKAIRAVTAAEAVGGALDTYVFLTRAEHDPDEKFHYVRMPKEWNNGPISIFQSGGGSCLDWHVMFLRPLNNLKQIYMINTYRQGHIPYEPDASLKITIYELTPEDEYGRPLHRPAKKNEDLNYEFIAVKSAEATHQTACDEDDIRKLELQELGIEIQAK